MGKLKEGLAQEKKKRFHKELYEETCKDINKYPPYVRTKVMMCTASRPYDSCFSALTGGNLLVLAICPIMPCSYTCCADTWGWTLPWRARSSHIWAFLLVRLLGHTQPNPARCRCRCRLSIWPQVLLMLISVRRDNGMLTCCNML